MEQTSPEKQASDFLSIAGEFRLGDLTTEKSHPVTGNLSQVASDSTIEALRLLFKVDEDVLSTYRHWISTGATERISSVVIDAITEGHKIFFTGCGATGRLSILLESIWRKYWKTPDTTPEDSLGNTYYAPELPIPSSTAAIESLNPGNQVRSIMAGGDYALIKSVEGFEDFTQFGKKQIEDMGVSAGDVVFAITEGGETSFVIGTAWKGLETGAKVYFVYCNPDDVLREKVKRSREIIDEQRIEKINLTTGPMAIMGSTRMQATSIQFLAMVTVLEIAARRLCQSADGEFKTADIISQFSAAIGDAFSLLTSDDVLAELSALVDLEADSYRSKNKSTYFANYLGIDVLTDTTERSPTFCTPAFRKWDDPDASDSWTYLILPYPNSYMGWRGLLKRPPYGLQWSPGEIQALVPPEVAPRQIEIMKQIGPAEIHRFRIGQDGLGHRPIVGGDHVVCVVTDREMDQLISPQGFYRKNIEDAVNAGASAAVVFLGGGEAITRVRSFLDSWTVKPSAALIPIPETGFVLDGLTRAIAKMALNALSTCIMVRLGRVQGNCMVAVVPSNLKLIDRSARYIQVLTGLQYEESCRLLFQAIEYVKPRMAAGQSYPPPVALTFEAWKRNCSLEVAESHLA